MRLILVAALLTASPAVAQIAGRSGGGYGTRVPAAVNRGTGWGGLGGVYDRIDKGRDSGQLSRREARRLRRDAGRIGDAAGRYTVGGLSDAERRELDTRAQVLSDRVDAARLGVGTTPRP